MFSITNIKGKLKISITFTVFLTLISFLNSNAIGHMSVKHSEDLNSFLLRLSQMNGRELMLGVEDVINNDLLFSRNYKKSDDLALILNMSELSDGFYKIVAHSGVDSYVKNIRIENKVAKIISDPRFDKPIFSIKNNIVQLSHINSKDKEVWVTIYDDNDEFIYEDISKGDNAFAKMYDLNSLPSGRYRIVMSVGNDFYTKKVNVSSDNLKICVR